PTDRRRRRSVPAADLRPGPCRRCARRQRGWSGQSRGYLRGGGGVEQGVGWWGGCRWAGGQHLVQRVARIDAFAQCGAAPEQVEEVRPPGGRFPPELLLGVERGEGAQQRVPGAHRVEGGRVAQVQLCAGAPSWWANTGTSTASRTCPPGSACSVRVAASRASVHGALNSSNGFVVPLPSDSVVPSSSPVPG